jgi:hypothetical protein
LFSLLLSLSATALRLHRFQWSPSLARGSKSPAALVEG